MIDCVLIVLAQKVEGAGAILNFFVGLDVVTSYLDKGWGWGGGKILPSWVHHTFSYLQ